MNQDWHNLSVSAGVRPLLRKGLAPLPWLVVVSVLTVFPTLASAATPGHMGLWGSIESSYVPPGTIFQSIAAGLDHNLAITTRSNAVGWGNNYDGQASIPAGLSNVVAVAGGTFHSIGLKSDGTVMAWGASSAATVGPPGLNNVVAIANGGDHNLALKKDGTVVAWGDNDKGQLNIPPGLNGVAAIAAGGGCACFPSYGFSMALKSNGTVVVTTTASSPR